MTAVFSESSLELTMFEVTRCDENAKPVVQLFQTIQSRTDGFSCKFIFGEENG